MTIPKEIAREMVWEKPGTFVGEFEVVQNQLSHHTRWSLVYDLVVKYEDRYFATSYSKGATESQDESPFEYDGDDIEFREVHKLQKIVDFYE